MKPVFFLLILALLHLIFKNCAIQDQGKHPFNERLLFQQHAAHIGKLNKRNLRRSGIEIGNGASLQAFLGMLQGALVGC